MTESAEKIVNKWLREMKIPVSKQYIRQQLLSHPDYPSLSSITDLLNELGIENSAIQIEKDQLHEMPVPFLAHLNGGGGEFVIIKNRDNLEKQFPDFFKRWNGVSIAAEKSGNWQHKENNEWVKKDHKQLIAVTFTLILLFAFVLLSKIFSVYWLHTSLLLVATAGIFVSWMIVSRELGIDNKIADQVCGKEANCDSVINSKTIKLPFGIGWSDAGVIYFSFLLLDILIFSFGENNSGLYNLLSILATCAIPVTFLSVYYQWRVIKKWCRLCLITVTLLWTQFFVLLPHIISLTKNGFSNISLNNILLSSFLLFITAAAWLCFKPLLKENKKLENENFAAKRFKQNTDVFVALLEKQRRIDTTPFNNDLQIGNPEARLQIIVACNPYCGPCAKAHETLNGLVERNDIGLTVRFTIKTDNKEDKKLQAVEYIHQLVNEKETEYKRQVLHEWYKEMNLEKFKKNYQTIEQSSKTKINESPFCNKVVKVLQEHEKWSNESKIIATPTIFINGYELPKQYNVKDLIGLIRGIIANHINEIDAVGQMKQQTQY
jgi:protein-disulfide isomerase